jgi:UDP-2-acetamido-3-amino-2,3-dideoxy-glucuronate N-acetyltransferase
MQDASPSHYQSHETAIVEPNAEIGANTAIWHHAHVRSGARIGDQCMLGKNVYVDADAIIGDRCRIQNNVSVYAGVELENDVFVGPSVVFTNDLVPRAGSAEWRVVPTLVRQGASLGANSTILCGVTIGKYATVGAGAVVTRDVDDHWLVTGNPARHVGWVCTCGYVIGHGHEKPLSECPSCGKTLDR